MLGTNFQNYFFSCTLKHILWGTIAGFDCGYVTQVNNQFQIQLSYELQQLSSENI